MNIKKIMNSVLENWPVKVICFIAAVLVFFYHELSTLSSRSYMVPVKILENGELTLSSEADESRHVKVTVRSKRENLADITEGDFNAFLDMNRVKEAGRIAVDINVVPDSKVMLIDPLEITYSPRTLYVPVEKYISRYVPVKPSVTGSAAYGYEMVNYSIEPDVVLIEGPESAVNAVESISTENVSLTGASRDVVAVSSLLHTSSRIEIPSSENFKVVLYVRPVGTSRTIKNVPVTYKNIPETLFVSNQEESVDITVEGSMLSLDKLSPSDFICTADLADLEKEGTHVLRLVVSGPKDIDVIKVSREELSVILSSSDSEETILLPEEIIVEDSKSIEKTEKTEKTEKIEKSEKIENAEIIHEDAAAIKEEAGN
ncbi:CdaR family protein [Treponema sp.]|uniref:CdaR family protein n=1 Tax=Treponema sp. TaxID=166 RepID=UPI0025E7C937|nr:CdaR family protein [Treponema sp.]MCR5218113.1 hypothetical protein [Treponema sp.]